MDVKSWIRETLASRRPMPILSFPSAQLLGCSVRELTHSAELQARGIALVASRTPAAAAVTMMDLSVEAEAFGCTLRVEEDEVPTVVGTLLSDESDADALAVPPVGAARTGLYIEAARGAKALVTDRPVLAGIIGPFSLAGRLMDVEEALVNCLADPDFVLATLEKTCAFLVEYARAYKAAGLDGIVIAEPLSGLLSPALEEEFSAPFVRRIIEAVADDTFAVVYHNCGPNVTKMTASFATLGATMYHFGDAVDIVEMLEQMPAGCIVAGNVSPSEQFLGGTPASMTETVRTLRARTAGYANYILSSGCDIPPKASWDNIDAFFSAALA